MTLAAGADVTMPSEADFISGIDLELHRGRDLAAAQPADGVASGSVASPAVVAQLPGSVTAASRPVTATAGSAVIEARATVADVHQLAGTQSPAAARSSDAHSRRPRLHRRRRRALLPCARRARSRRKRVPARGAFSSAPFRCPATPSGCGHG